VSGCHEIIEDAEAGIELDVLKGTGDAKFSDLVRGQVRDVAAFKEDFAFLGAVETVNAIEKAAFSSPIGSDDSQYLRTPDLNIHTAKSTKLPKI